MVTYFLAVCLKLVFKLFGRSLFEDTQLGSGLGEFSIWWILKINSLAWKNVICGFEVNSLNQLILKTTHVLLEELFCLKSVASSFESLLFKDTQLGPGPGSAGLPLILSQKKNVFFHLEPQKLMKTQNNFIIPKRNLFKGCEWAEGSSELVLAVQEQSATQR